MKIKLCILFVITINIILLVIFYFNHIIKAASSSTNPELKLIVESKNQSILPKNFRRTDTQIDIAENTPNLVGLSNLNASGSGQFSQKGLNLIKQQLGNDFEIIDVDLRKESHGFVNGMPISWYGTNNNANLNLQHSEVVFREKMQLTTLKKFPNIYFDVLPDNNSIDVDSVQPDAIQTEEELVIQNNINYFRLTIPDNYRPSNSEVDNFVEFIKILSHKSWLHFHCKHGIERTTTFMLMYDMMKNANKVSLADINKRQIILGGAELINIDATECSSADKSRKYFLINFYQYCFENIATNFLKTWSKWSKSYATPSISPSASPSVNPLVTP